MLKVFQKKLAEFLYPLCHDAVFPLQEVEGAVTALSRERKSEEQALLLVILRGADGHDSRAESLRDHVLDRFRIVDAGGDIQGGLRDACLLQEQVHRVLAGAAFLPEDHRFLQEFVFGSGLHREW